MIVQFSMTSTYCEGKCHSVAVPQYTIGVVWCGVWCQVCKILSVSGGSPAYHRLDQAGKLTDPFLQPARAETEQTGRIPGRHRQTQSVLPSPQLSPGSHSAH